METVDFKPQISPNRRGVILVLAWKSASVECMISRATLETHFRLPTDADDAKMLKIFHDGANRIHAVAHRKLLARPAARLELTTTDFIRS